MDRKAKIFLSLCETAGYFSHLKNGFQELGYKARTGFVRYHAFGYKTERNIELIHKLILINSKMLFASMPIIFRIPFFFIHRFILLPIFFVQCLLKYNVFIFGFRKTFLPLLLDLPILRLFNKTIIFVFHGSDSRPAYLNGSLNGFSIEKLYSYNAKIKRELRMVCKFANHIVEAPATTMFFNRPLINELLIGTAQRQDVSKISKQPQNIIIQILHCPSNPEAKGTRIIRQATDELKNEGHKFEYTELTNRTNQEVLDAICQSDFVIDQMYSDKPMAVFAAEAAFYGKPAIVGGYDLDEISKILPKDSLPPSYIIQPTKEELKKAIVHLINDRIFREKLGRKAQDFVHRNWDATEVAKRFLRIINNDIPKEWYIDPYKMPFIHGCCIEDEQRKMLINEYIRKYGRKALCLSDKIELEKKLLNNIAPSCVMTSPPKTEPLT